MIPPRMLATSVDSVAASRLAPVWLRLPLRQTSMIELERSRSAAYVSSSAGGTLTALGNRPELSSAG